MGKYDEKRKKWLPGEPIEDGMQNEMFTEKGAVVQVRLTLAGDDKTIQQVLVQKSGEPLEMADSEFDAVLRSFGAQTNGNGPITYVRLELDGKGKIIKQFALTTGRVTAETQIVMGKYNEQEKKWEAGEPLAGGLYHETFNDLRRRPVYVRMQKSADGRGFDRILVCRLANK
jgi:hypothetical protein